MAKSKKQQLTDSKSHSCSLHKLSSRHKKVCHHKKVHVKASQKKEWNNSLCSVCMEYPHNAVLLLCSSYDNGCRPYMCATSHRYSNCLEQFKKACTKVVPDKVMRLRQLRRTLFGDSPDSEDDGDMSKMSELLCPLCRGQVKGWTIVKPARRYFNRKKRTCLQDDCSYVGTYKEIKKHVKLEHPLARPRQVDPSHVKKWKKLENERELDDVFSTIRSTMPGSIVVGDYVIERNRYHQDSHTLLGFPSYGGSWNNFSHDTLERDYDTLDEERFRRLSVRSGINIARVGRPHARILLGARRVGSGR